MLKKDLKIELERKFVLYPIIISLGILSYFKGFAMQLPLSFAIVGTIFISLYFVKKNVAFHFILMMVSLFIIGNMAITYRVIEVNAPILEKKLDNIWITGDVEFVEDRESEKRFYLTNASIRQLKKEKIPKKIRVNVRISDTDFNIGDRICLKGSLLPPPGPVLPGGFDFRRFAYFKKLGAIGYAVSKPFLLEKSTHIDHFQDKVNLLRTNIIKRIKEIISEPASVIAAGLLVGDSSGISKKDFDAMRIAGTAHLIAISGMHIALISGMLFFTVRFLLVRIEPLSKRYNVKKFAAIISLIGSYGYLVIAGSPISGERAFLMSSIVLIAVIIDRNTDAIRSLAIAAMVLMIFQPESILSPSLQMSISACIGLITGFNSSFYLLISKIGNKNVISKITLYLLSVTFATLTAGFATSVFIAYHFNQFSPYSVIANMIAVPLSDFLIMPFGFLGLFFMPLNLDHLFFIPMSWFINLMIKVSLWVSEMDNSMIFIPNFSDAALSLVVFGGLIFCLLSTKLRYLGIPLVIFGIYQIHKSSPPDILISGSGQMFAVRKEGSLLFSSRSKERFVRKSWMQSSGLNNAKTLPKNGLCNRYVCTVNHDDKKVIIVTDEKYLKTACTKSNIFINMTEEKYECPDSNLNVSKHSIISRGAIVIYFSKKEVTLQSVVK